MTGPRCLMMIRHGEKPANGDAGVDAAGAPDDHGLTPRGWQRAGALAVRFGRSAEGPCPSALVAPSYPHGTHRPSLTLLPLSHILGIEIRTPFGADDDPAAIADWLLTQPDEVVLLCWEHHSLVDIARAVGAHAPVVNIGDIPREWPDDRFDLVWRFDRDPVGSWSFARGNLGLLAGDEPR